MSLRLRGVPWLLTCCIAVGVGATGCQLLLGADDHVLRVDCDGDGDGCDAGDIEPGVDATDEASSADAGAAGGDGASSPEVGEFATDAPSSEDGEAATGADEVADATDAAPDGADASESSDAGCEPPLDRIYYVDSTAPSGGTGSLACKFRTLTETFSAITKSGANQAADVFVIVAGSISESTEGQGAFPLSVPPRVRVRGAADVYWPVITAPPGTSAFRFESAAAGALEDLNVRQDVLGNTGSGLVVSGTKAAGNLAPITLRNVSFRNFAHGIDVQKNGYLNVLSGVTVESNFLGLNVVDGFVRIRVDKGESMTTFDQNNTEGIFVDGDHAILDIAGAISPAVADRLISISRNSGDGVRMRAPAGKDDGLALSNQIVGAAITNNESDGLRIFGGTAVKVRNCYLQQNTHAAVRMTDNGATGATNEITAIDFGHIQGSPGENNFYYNTPAFCFDFQKTTPTGLLWAEGNVFSSGIRVCSDPVSGPNTTLTWAPDCAHTYNLGYTNKVVFSDVIRVAYCKLP
jgi:hypothetical protein